MTLRARILVDACVLIDCIQPDSAQYAAARAFISSVTAGDIPLLMPAHGWFEVKCARKRLTEGRVRADTLSPLRMELIHIDDKFLRKYGNVDVPYTKSGDHIYLVVAYKNGYDLVTSDGPLTKAAIKAGVRVFSPKDYVARTD